MQPVYAITAIVKCPARPGFTHLRKLNLGKNFSSDSLSFLVIRAWAYQFSFWVQVETTRIQVAKTVKRGVHLMLSVMSASKARLKFIYLRSRYYIRLVANYLLVQDILITADYIIRYSHMVEKSNEVTFATKEKLFSKWNQEPVMKSGLEDQSIIMIVAYLLWIISAIFTSIQIWHVNFKCLQICCSSFNLTVFR